MKFPTESTGAKVLRQIRGGRSAWYKAVIGGFQVGLKRNDRAQASYHIVSSEADARAAVDNYIDGSALKPFKAN
jgi:hypothetical protein